MAANELVLGVGDFTVTNILRTMKGTSIYPSIQEKWTSIGRGLDIPSEKLRMLRERVIACQMTVNDVMYDMLESWIAMKGATATLAALLKVLRDNGCYHFAEVLRQRFIPNAEDEVQDAALEVDADPSSKVIIGSRECPIHRVVSTIESSFGFCSFHTHWGIIARDLGIPSEEIQRIRRNLADGIIRLPDALEDIILNWVSRDGSAATLDKLLQSLENVRMTECAELLKEKFLPEPTPS